MCLFVQKLDDSVGDYRYYCSQCCFESQRLRYVLDCWERGCCTNCDFFGDACIRNENPRSPSGTEKSARYFSKGGFYKVLRHEPGLCFACGGSGLADSASKRLCARCEGSGVCPGCHGKFVRYEKDLDAIEYVREW